MNVPGLYLVVVMGLALLMTEQSEREGGEEGIELLKIEVEKGTKENKCVKIYKFRQKQRYQSRIGRF